MTKLYGSLLVDSSLSVRLVMRSLKLLKRHSFHYNTDYKLY